MLGLLLSRHAALHDDSEGGGSSFLQISGGLAVAALVALLVVIGLASAVLIDNVRRRRGSVTVSKLG